MSEDIHRMSIEATEEAFSDIDLEKDTDEIIGQKIELRLREGQQLYDSIIKEVKENEKLFFGELDSVSNTNLNKYNSKAVYNRVFLTIRNMVGMDTDNLPKVQMLPSKDTPPSIKRAEKIKNAIEYGFIRVEFMDFITKCLFDTRIKRDSFAKWYWDYKRNDFSVEPVMIEEITLSPEATNIQDSEFLVYHPMKSRSWWKLQHPEVYDKIKFDNLKIERLASRSGTNNEMDLKGTGRGSLARLYEYWENDLTISMVYGKEGEKIILEKKKNPYYEYRDPMLQMTDWAKQTRPEQFAQAQMQSQVTGMPIDQTLTQALDPQDVENFKPIVNFLSESRKPFVQFPSMKLLGKMYSSNLIAQVKEVLIAYNEKKRQISDNLKNCNTKVVVDSNSFTEEERASINDEPFQVLFADMQQNQHPVQIVSPTFAELGGIITDEEQDEKYIDDVFGHHEISRGSGNAGTLGQDQMNQESDRVPVRMQSRAIESAIKEITEGWIQLIKMFYTEKHWVKKLGGKDGVEMQDLINHDVEEGIEPIIIPQSMIKLDKVARAIQLYSMQALDPYTLFAELEVSNPEEKATRLVNWLKFGMLTPQDSESLASDMTGGANSAGDGTENPIERADMENKGFQAGGGKDIPPTPPELVTKEHVKLHFDFYKDPNKKMDQGDMDLLEAHAQVDKATLTKVLTESVMKGATQQRQQEKELKQTK